MLDLLIYGCRYPADVQARTSKSGLRKKIQRERKAAINSEQTPNSLRELELFCNRHFTNLDMECYDLIETTTDDTGALIFGRENMVHLLDDADAFQFDTSFKVKNFSLCDIVQVSTRWASFSEQYEDQGWT